MKVRLQLASLTAPLPADVPTWALAWYNAGVVTVRSPFHFVFFSLQRLGHELAHAKGEDHHPWWHFCLRSPGALRLRWTHTRVTRAEASELGMVGSVDV